MGIDNWLQFHGQTIIVLGGVLALVGLGWQKLIRLMRSILEQAVSSNQTIAELKAQDKANNDEAKEHWSTLHTRQDDIWNRLSDTESVIRNFRPTLTEALGTQGRLVSDVDDVKERVETLEQRVDGVEVRIDRLEKKQ